MKQHQRAGKRANPALAWRALVALASTTLAAAPIVAQADVTIIGPTLIDPSSYTGDSSHGVTDFENAIAGQTLTLIPFTLTSAGELIVLDGQEERTALSDTFSEEVLFRSPGYTPEAFPELGEAAHPNQVGLTGNLYEDDSEEIRTPDNYRIFPLPDLSQPLEIDFVTAEEDTGVLAVGLGLYATSGRTITVFDADDDEITNYAHSGDDGFVFIGFVATTPEDAIGRVEITGDETAVVDVSFVPEPATGIASAVALFAVFGLARRRRP